MHARELRTFALVKATAGVIAPPGGGGVEVGGFVFARETLADMAAVDLGAPGEALAARMLVMSRTENGYAAMMRDDPYDSVVPSAALDAIVAWLAGVGDRVIASPPPASTPVPIIEVPTTDGRGTLRETSLRFGDDDRLFGIVTEPPCGCPVHGPAVCLLNVGADHHVGPHRMSVDLARDLASRGWLTMRFDAAGLGDSLAAPGARENRIYTKDAIDDVRQAMDLLGAMHGARRFVLMGVCSGAFLAFHTTLADARVAGQLLVSPFAFEWKEGDPVTPTGRSAEPLPSAGRGNAVERAFLATCDRGVASLIVSASNDGGLDVVAAHLGPDASWLRDKQGFALEIVQDGDHTFTSRASQGALRAIVARYMGAQFA
jgi:dienelactone hydrolase